MRTEHFMPGNSETVKASAASTGWHNELEGLSASDKLTSSQLEIHQFRDLVAAIATEMEANAVDLSLCSFVS